MSFIRFGSHRARSYGLRALKRKPVAYFSLRRETGPGGVYEVTEDEITIMRDASRHARFTRLRGPFEDLMRCWGQGEEACAGTCERGIMRQADDSAAYLSVPCACPSRTA